MVKKLLPIVLLSGWFIQGFGQAFDYGNGWYHPAQPYAKFKVWEDGVYRVDAAALANVGFSVQPGSVANLQLFYRGREQYMYVKTVSGNLDFIEFYGLRNDGRVDSAMYRDPVTRLHDGSLQPNKHLSLFSDTAAYFLTVGPQPGLRYDTFSDLDFGNYSPEPHFRYRSYQEYHPRNPWTCTWNVGGGSQYDMFHNLNSYYVTGEGYVGEEFTHYAPRMVSVPTKYAANVGTNSEFESRVYGRSSWQHIQKTTVDGHVMVLDTIQGIYIRTWTLPYPFPLNNSTSVYYEGLGDQNGNIDNNNIIYTQMTYDRLFNMDGQSSILISDWQKGTNAYFQFTNTSTTSSALAFDLTTHIRCSGVGSGNTMRVVVPGSAAKRDIWVGGEDAVRTPLVEVPRFGDLSDPGAGASFVIITDRSLAASATAYKVYRDSCTVNPQTAKVVYTDEIYEGFGSGTVTPYAIKRFCKYAMDAWAIKPKFFLLWGKGQYRTRDSPLNLVPTYGYPANDYDFVSDYDPYRPNLVPQAAIGRVNVYDDQDGQVYLDKINEYEHTAWAPWMKEAVLLGGGSDTLEQQAIFYYLKRYIPLWDAPPMGGNGSYHQKFNTGELTNASMSSTRRIHAGVSLIHFFGHSSSNIYDVDIQEPSLYLNHGKYPTMLAFGCYGGDFTGDQKSFGERFVLAEGRGSISYIANSTAGFLTPLGEFGDAFHRHLCDSSFGKPIGEIMRLSLRDFQRPWNDPSITNHAKQLNLQGDPSIRIYHPVKPDLSISNDGVFFTPGNFSAADSSVTMNIVVNNYGLVTSDSFFLSIRQQLPSGTWIAHPSIKLAPVQRVDTISVLLYNAAGAAMAGLNQFDIFADSTNVLEEYREDNNRLQYPYIVPGNTPAILSPHDFAVIDSPGVTLAASAYVMSRLGSIGYLYEIDTVPTFNSPRHASSPKIAGSAVYSEWAVPFQLTDCTVYYWRVRLADTYPDTWANASFKYIAQRKGWAQSRPPQFYTDPVERVTMNRVQRQWAFDQWVSDLHAYTSAGGHAVYRLANGAYSSDLSSTPPGIMYTPIRGKDLKPAITGTINGDWAYAPMPGGHNAVAASIASLAKGDYFLAVSEQDPRVAQWPPHVRAAFAMIGCDTGLLNNFTPGNALIVLGRKGFPGQGILMTTPNVFDESTQTWHTDLRKTMQSNYATGSVTSTTIGPAISWKDLTWDWGSMDPFPDEDARVSLYVSRDGSKDSLYLPNLMAGSYTLTGINARKYPYLRLRAALKDSAFLTAPQLEHWHVTYHPAPDALIDPVSLWEFDLDTVTQGENATVRYLVQNISGTDMDSLLVRYQAQLPDRRTMEVGRKRFAPLAAGQSMVHAYTFSTNFPGMTGELVFSVELNPENDQPELHHFNNLFAYPFKVVPDKINPILDVTVDGKHLMEGDIVSPLPEIRVQINDENRFMALNDTAFEIYFGAKNPNPSSLPRVFISGDSRIQVESAHLPENKAKLNFRPGHLEDGDYTLRVQGYDQAGNAAGRVAYEINFKVINEVALSNVLNYPNPFSSATRFVYILTGSEMPEVFEIHIFTVSGKLVKVIDLNATNDVKVGYTVSDYAWDGRDEFGDLLANGVYIYKVVARLNGKPMKLREDGVTELFQNGYGKMYLMR